MRHITSEERRARLATRHALAPEYRASSPEDAVRAMTVLHATEPATAYLSYWARSHNPTIERMNRALYEEHTLIKQLAMRRTLFIFPRELLAYGLASASARVAGIERTRMVKDIVRTGTAKNGDRWLDSLCAEVLTQLDLHKQGLSVLELRKLIPGMTTKIAAKVPWSGSQVLIYLGARGDIVRGTNRGRWATTQPRWVLMRDWLGQRLECTNADAGYLELVRRWLHTFGPGTEEDVVWWLGSTKAAVRKALTELQAVQVSLDHDGCGWLLPGDLPEIRDPGSWVALLPALDPTVMGWKERRFYLNGYKESLFDRAGNGGPTIWVDGRIVGGWVQNGDGVVELRLLERISTKAQQALRWEASRLTEWLGGVRLTTSLRFPEIRSTK